jgi:hypothetical protein
MAYPSGWRISEPVPVPSISGTPPSIAAMVVIMIGRKRSSAALRIDCSGDRCSSRSAEIAKSTIMMPFFLTMPIKRMMPISAIRLKS